METKQSIRKQIFAVRKAHTQEQIEAMSEKICQTVIGLPIFREADFFYAYADYNKEVMTRGMIEAAWRAKKRVAVPKVQGKDLLFYELKDFSQLEPGYYQIPEPARGEMVQWEDALLLMPGVAFDPARHRVGYGAGFYDRYLEKHPLHSTVAVAFDFQIVPKAPSEPTDILPQLVVTESKIYV